MKIFVSWSGARSKELARLLKEWLPKVIQECEPWFSEKDIPSGAPWPTEIATNLNEARFGIICVTPENLSAPWLFFESGALTSHMGQPRLVCPLILGMDKSQLGTPLGLFHARSATDKEDFLELLRDINANSDGKKLDEDVLESVFEKFWGEFIERAKAIEKKPVPAGAGGKGAPGISFDCTQEEFVNRLSACDEVTILGITNGSLPGCLDKAWEKRKLANDKPWNKVEIIFPAKHLLKDMPFPGIANAQRTIENLNRRWETGVERARQFLRSYSNPDKPERLRARYVEVRSYDKPFPFVGQVYDNSAVRVTYILPDKDIKSSCYINLEKNNPPCKTLKGRQAPSLESNEAPPCKKANSRPVNCDSCQWEEEHSPCHAIYNAFRKISTGSTPLLAANIVGAIANRKNPRFVFSTLRPQNNWRETLHTADTERPVHLLAFVLMRYGHEVCLLLRNEKNASGEYNKYGVLPGKVNDVDFFDGMPNEEYRELVYQMQKAWDTHEADPSLNTFIRISQVASQSFGKQLGVQVDAPMQEALLNAACTQAAIRSIREKIGLEIPENRLRLIKNKFLVIQGDYELFIRCFVLDLKKIELGSITRTDFVRKSAAELKRLKREERLTDFLTKYNDEVIAMLGPSSKGKK